MKRSTALILMGVALLVIAAFAGAVLLSNTQVAHGQVIFTEPPVVETILYFPVVLKGYSMPHKWLCFIFPEFCLGELQDVTPTR